MASVAYNHVTKRYSAEAVAVSDLNLQILDTDFIVLVGPSGCGKSTALRMLAVVEILGSNQYLYGKVGGDDITARVDSRRKDLGQGERAPTPPG